MSLRADVRAVIEKLYAAGFREFRCGGALGFDTLAALEVLAYRREKEDISLVLMLPCRDQDKAWTPSQKQLYRDILERADEVRVLAEHYYRGCMFVRNRALVDGSECCIAYLTSDRGGTKMTVNYAEKQGINVINLGGKTI